jgi:hypothetical protein
MLSCKHLDDQAPDAPYISLLRVRDLFDNLGGHPIDRALERRTVQAIPRHEIFQSVLSNPYTDEGRSQDSLSSNFFEMPKSEILIPPLLSTRTFAPLMSRWTMPRS